jgi:putative transposase
MGLNPGPVPARVDAHVKAGLLGLVDDALAAGWSARQAAACLGLDHVRVLRWAARRVAGQLADVRPGPVEALHALLPWEREAVVKLAAEWGEVDRSHRKLAHRGSRLALVHVSESTVLRVLTDEGVHLPRPPARDRGARAPWPEWADWRPGVIWVYDFTHFTRAKRCAVAVLDVVSRYWLSTVVSAEETSMQIQNAFCDALRRDGKEDLLDDWLLAQLSSGTVPDGEKIPVLLALSDNGTQMTSRSTKAFMAACAIQQRFGRPATPNDQAWIESLFSHIKGEHPHLEAIRDPGELDSELDRVRREHNEVRLHAAIGYVTPDDEHHGRGEAIRAARRAGLQAAHAARISYRRQQHHNP